VLSLKAVT